VNRFAVPADLRERRQWVVWRQRKIPYQARAPELRASTTDARTWAPFERAISTCARGKADGIGFVFAENDPFFGVDLDGCRNPETGELSPVAAALVAELDSYAELSLSGRGVHVIARGRLERGRCRRGAIEIYDRGRYFVVTGGRLNGVPHNPMPRQHELDQLRARLFPPEPSLPAPIRPLSVCEDDRQLLERMFAARNGSAVEALYHGDTSGYPSHSEADLALCRHLAFWTGGDAARVDALFRTSGLMRPKWYRRGYREITILRALS
jgi:primase-polymerase (primpol)-like protein